eukprot:m.103148 g.103148  ORF g.103148 m.103148 type:complete len:869 (-) comp13797_c0_seq4:165-2771(-)
MALVGIILALCPLVRSVNITLPSERSGIKLFHGIGALSAGASSRLLKDYDQPTRDILLDILFKPDYAASLHILKIEIGGDTQSTDGTEPSFKHFKDDEPKCERGYEAWLAKEAKKRNPDIIIYGLSWGVPGWVGENEPPKSNGKHRTFCSKDNIEYQTAWVKCMNESQGIQIDYLGIWNEVSWCSEDYVVTLRESLDEAGYGHTRLVLPDGGVNMEDQFGLSFFDAYNQSEALRNVTYALGLHYPCHQPSEVLDLGLPLWASEDYSDSVDTSSVASRGWTAGGCWGKILNNNFIRLNATSTIAWSLIWSVYDDLACNANGLTLANSPWSSNFTVDAPIWMSAHWTHFIKPGWYLLPASSGFLEFGGSFVAAVSLNTDGSVKDFSLVVDVLQGDCKKCTHSSPNATQTKTFQFNQDILKPLQSLNVWRTTSNEMFYPQPKVSLDMNGTLKLTLLPDAMYTFTTVDAGSRAVIPQSSPAEPFPLPYTDTFDNYSNDTMARYWSDQGGSWSVETPHIGVGALKQWVVQPPLNNSWAGGSKPSNPTPLTILGSSSWTNYMSCISGKLDTKVLGNKDAFIMACVAVTSFSPWSGWPATSVCLQVNATGLWRLVGFQNMVPSTSNESRYDIFVSGSVTPSTTSDFMRLCLRVQCGIVDAYLNGKQVASGINTAEYGVSNGRVSIGTGWHQAIFDNFTVTPLASKDTDKIFICSQTGTQLRKGMNGYIGAQLKIGSKDVVAWQLARICVPSSIADRKHTLYLLQITNDENIRVLGSTNIQSDSNCTSADSDGFVWGTLATNISLPSGAQVIVASHELSTTDAWYGVGGIGLPSVAPNSAISAVLPVWSTNLSQFTIIQAANHIYGPVNMRLTDSY